MNSEISLALQENIYLQKIYFDKICVGLNLHTASSYFEVAMPIAWLFPVQKLQCTNKMDSIHYLLTILDLQESY